MTNWQIICVSNVLFLQLLTFTRALSEFLSFHVGVVITNRGQVLLPVRFCMAARDSPHYVTSWCCRYGTVGSMGSGHSGGWNNVERSGAYLFLPGGSAVPLQIENTIVKVVQGPVLHSVIVQLPYILHTVNLYETPGNYSLIFILIAVASK